MLAIEPQRIRRPTRRRLVAGAAAMAELERIECGGMRRGGGRESRRVSSAGGAFLPTQIPGLVLWLRADLGITLNGSTVSAWADKSGIGDANRNLAQATGSKQPALNVSDAAYNNRPTLSFASASSQNMLSGTWSSPLAQPCTVFFVGQSSMSSTQGFFDDILGVENMTAFVVSTPAIEIQSGGTVCSFNTSLPASPMVFVGVYNGLTSALYINGGAARQSSNVTAVSNLTGLTLGSFKGGIDYLNGKIAEIACWNRVLTATELETLAQYAGQLYGIAVT